VTLREFLPKLLPILEARHSASTYDSERRGLKVLADYFGKRAMKDVTTAEVTKFITMLRRDRGLAPSTVNQYLTHVSVAWKEAIEHGYAKENPARGVKRLRIERRPVPYLSDRDIEAIVSGAAERARPALRILYETGLRRGELANLRWQDVDLRRGQLVVRKSKSKRPREIPLSGPAGAAFEGQARRRKSLDNSTAVFPWIAERPERITEAFEQAIRAAGMARLRLHDLRHGFGSRLAHAGVTIPVIQRLMGHSTVEMTMRYACHSPDGAERAGIDLADSKRHTSPRVLGA
jgi:integrase